MPPTNVRAILRRYDDELPSGSVRGNVAATVRNGDVRGVPTRNLFGDGGGTRRGFGGRQSRLFSG